MYSGAQIIQASACSNMASNSDTPSGRPSLSSAGVYRGRLAAQRSTMDIVCPFSDPTLHQSSANSLFLPSDAAMTRILTMVADVDSSKEDEGKWL